MKIELEVKNIMPVNVPSLAEYLQSYVRSAGGEIVGLTWRIVEELPPRGTGLETGTAREERGKGVPLTEEERAERHKEVGEGGEERAPETE